MSLNPTMLDVSVRIIGDIADSRMVSGQRRGVKGTGFLCAVPSRNLPGVRYGYVVTAHHVIADQNEPEVQAPIPRSNGSALQDPVLVRDWIQPLPDVDLAFARFGGQHGGMWAGLDTSKRFLPPNINPPLGGPVHYVGILDPEDRVMARSGTVGALDQRGIEHPEGYVYPAHLIDCRSYDGFSGSPCYAEFSAPVLEHFDQSLLPHIDREEGDTAPRGSMDHYTWFCGMLTWHLEDKRNARASQYGVVAMLPHYEVWRGLMTDQDDRDAADEVNAAKLKGGPKPTNISAGRVEELSEFERFERLAGQLARTPKSEGESGPPQ